MNESKIDKVVNGMIDSIRENDKGFVLSLGKAAAPHVTARLDEILERLTVMDVGEDTLSELKALVQQVSEPVLTSVSVSEDLPPIDDYIPPALLRKHILLDTESLIAFAKRYGDAAKSLVMYDDKAVTLTLDELIEIGDRETVTMPLEQSADFAQWSNVIGKPQTHKSLMKFLINNSHNLDEPTLLDAMRVFRSTTSVVQDSDITDDGRHMSFLVKQSSGEEKAKFPKVIKVNVPILAQDVEERDKWLTADLRLEIELPSEPKDPPTFTLSSSQWRQYYVNRVDHEGEFIREALPGFTVVRGRHDTFARRIGRPGSAD